MNSLSWIKSTSAQWLNFETVNLQNVNASGVYIIWHTGNPGRVVYVGQGDVAARLTAHRSRKDILQYAKNGTLCVTWASVPANQRNGVERYLADKWNPLVGEAHPVASPIAVNSPW